MENDTQNFTHWASDKIIQPVYWAEDKDGNINFDVESMRYEFEKVMCFMEKHNDNSDFDWDNC
jgi:hypothetical protein